MYSVLLLLRGYARSTRIYAPHLSCIEGLRTISASPKAVGRWILLTLNNGKCLDAPHVSSTECRSRNSTGPGRDIYPLVDASALKTSDLKPPSVHARRSTSAMIKESSGSPLRGLDLASSWTRVGTVDVGRDGLNIQSLSIPRDASNHNNFYVVIVSVC
jgi:hypothetical protein